MQLQRLILSPVLLLASAALLLSGVQGCSSDSATRQNSYFGYSNDPDRTPDYPEARIDVAAAPSPASTPAPNAPANAMDNGNYYGESNINTRAGAAAELRDWSTTKQQYNYDFEQSDQQYYDAEQFALDRNYRDGQSRNINYSADPVFNEGANIYIENYYDYSDPNYYGSNVHAASFGPRHHAFDYRPGWSFHLGFGHPHTVWSVAHHRFNYWDDFYCHRPFLGHRAWTSRAWICDPWFYDPWFYDPWLYDPWCPPFRRRALIGFHYGGWGGHWGHHYWRHGWGHHHGGYWGHHGGHDGDADRPRSERSRRTFGANSGVGANAGGVTSSSAGNGGGRVRLTEPRRVMSDAERRTAEINTGAADAGNSQFGSTNSPRTRTSLSGSIDPSTAGSPSTNNGTFSSENPRSSRTRSSLPGNSIDPSAASSTQANNGNLRSASPRSPRVRTSSSDVSNTRVNSTGNNSRLGSDETKVNRDINPRSARSFQQNRNQAAAPAAGNNRDKRTLRSSNTAVTGSAEDRARYNNAGRRSTQSAPNVQSGHTNTTQRPSSSGSQDVNSSNNTRRSTNPGNFGWSNQSNRTSTQSTNTSSSTTKRSSTTTRSGSSRSSNSNVQSTRPNRSSAATSRTSRSGTVRSTKPSSGSSKSSVKSSRSGSSKSSGSKSGGGRSRGKR